MSNDDYWIKVNQELAKLVVLVTLPPIEPDFDFTISYNNIWNIWDSSNINGICQLINE